MPMAGHVSIEMDPRCRRVVESFFPETEFHGDVCAFGEVQVQALALQYSNVGLILVGAGPPCQGVSGLNADRKGALRDERSCLFKEVPRITQLFRQAFPWAQVHELIENVASMSIEDRAIMSREFGRTPVRIDAKGISLCARPRLYWISWELLEQQDVEVEESTGEGWSRCQPLRLKGKVNGKGLLMPGWSLAEGCHLPTLTTSRPRATPGRRPAGLQHCQPHEVSRWVADRHRFPPYQYKDDHVLWNRQGMWRRPGIQEREALMGFPIDYTRQCVPKGERRGEGYEDIRMSMIGNSWHVGVVSWLVGQLSRSLGMGGLSAVQDIIDATTPGQARDFCSMLLRPPRQGRLGSGDSEAAVKLVSKRFGFSSMKGEDLMVHTGTDPAPKYFRLRASVPGRLWRWRDISGWRWRHSGERINLLELRAILTGIKWKLSRSKRWGIRFLHLTDSMVRMHALTRGPL